MGESDNGVYLHEVVSKIRYIADHEYDGKVYENILTIYHQLTTREREVLLRGVINICFLAQESVSCTRPHRTENKVSGEVDHEIKDIEDYNDFEMAKLRSWLVKMIAITVALMFFGFLGFMVFTTSSPDGNTSSSISSMFGNIIDVVKILIGKDK